MVKRLKHTASVRKGKAKSVAKSLRMNPLAACIRTAFIPASLALSMTPVMAGPQGGKVAAGQGTISKPNANTTLINQQTHNLSIDWSSFNIKQQELVHFQQPSKTANALNRIHDQNPSQIFGSLTATGNVFLVNPNGFYFSPTAKVHVGSLTASSLDISTNDFMAGKLDFEGVPGTDGVIVNQGLIEAATGGSVNLLGKAVKNEGVILAHAGQVNMVAGNKMTMDFDGDGLIQFTVDQEVLENAQALDAAVSNTGEIHADGGSVLLSGHAAAEVFSKVVNNEGVISAGRIEKKGGSVRLVATGSGSSLINMGIIDVSAKDAESSGGTVELSAENVTQSGVIKADATGGNGGTITIESTKTTLVTGNSVISATSELATGGSVHVLGDTVGLLDNTHINVSGALGGGEVLVGGDFQGNNPDIQNSKLTYVGHDVVINANATDNGDGGKIIVWADETTNYFSHSTARGGDNGGDGGFAEVSGKGNLVFSGTVDLRAPEGETGTLLLDPTDITISAGAIGGSDATLTIGALIECTAVCASAAATLTDGDLNNQLTLASVEVTTTSAGGGTGILLIDGTASVVSASNSLTLTSTTGNGDITINGSVNVGTGDLTLDASGNVTQSGSGVITADTLILDGGGTFTLDTLNNAITTLDADTAALGGNLGFRDDGGFDIDGINGGGNDVTLISDGIVSQSGVISNTNLLTLTSNAGGGVADFNLDTQNNAVTTLNADTVQLNTVLFRDDGGFTVSGIDADNTVTLTSAGNIVTTGTIASGALTVIGSTIDIDNAVSATGIDITAGTLIDIDAVTIDSNGSDLDLSGANIAIAGGATLQSTGGGGNAIFRGDDAGDTIGVGTNTGGADVDLSEGELQTVTSDFNSIVIGSVSQGGTITVDDAGGLTALNTDLHLNAGAGDVVVDSAIDLSTNAGVGVTISGDGTTTTLSNNIVTAGGAININDTVLVDGAILLDTTDGNTADAATITITDAIDGANVGGTDTLTIDAARDAVDGTADAAVNLGGAVGTGAVAGAQDFEGLTIDGAQIDITSVTVEGTGTIDVEGTGIDLNGTNPNFFTDEGAITFTGPVDLAGSGTVTVDSDNDGGGNDGAIMFTGAITDTGSDSSLVVDANTDTISVVNVTTGLNQTYTSGTIPGGSTQLHGTTYTTTAGGNFTINGQTEIFNNVTINTDGSSDGNVDLNGNIDADDAANAQTLTITAGTGTADLGNIGINDGDEEDLADLDVTAATINLNGTNYDLDVGVATDEITLTGAVNLNGAGVTIDVDNGANLTIDGTINNAQTFQISGGGSSDIDITGAVGGSTPLTSFTITDANTVDLNDITTTTGAINIGSVDPTGTINLNGTTYQSNDGNIDFNGNVVLNVSGGTVTVDSDADGGGGGTITFGGTINDDITGGAGDTNLTLDSGAADISLNNDVGVGVQIGDLTVTGNNVTFDANVEATAISVTAGATLTVDSTDDGTSYTLDANGGAITFTSDDIAILNDASDDISVLTSTGAAAGTDITFRGATTGSTILIGTDAGITADLRLDQVELDTVNATFTDIVIGWSGTQTGLITMDDTDVNQAITLSNTGLEINTLGTFDQNNEGDLTIQNGNDLTLTANSVLLGDDIHTEGGIVDITGDIISNSGTLTIETNVSSPGADITIDGTIDADNDFAQERTLDLFAGTGNVTVTDDIGVTEAFDGSNGVDIQGNVISVQAINTAEADDSDGGLVNIVGGGNVTVAGDITTNSAGGGNTPGVVTIDSSGTTLSVQSITASGDDGANIELNNNGGNSAITLNGSLNAVSTGGGGDNAGSITLGTDVTLATGPTITIDTTHTGGTNDGSITFAGDIDGAIDLTLDADTDGTISIAGDVGSSTPIGVFTVNDSAGLTVTGTFDNAGAVTVTDSSSVVFTGDFNTTGAVDITSQGVITFTGTFDNTSTVTLDGQGGGSNITFNGAFDSTGLVTITDANDVTINSTFDADQFDQQAGSGTTLIGSAAGHGGDFTIQNDIDITTNAITIQDDMTSVAGAVNLNVGTGDVHVTTVGLSNDVVDVTAGDDQPPSGDPGAKVRDITAAGDITITGGDMILDDAGNDAGPALGRLLTRIVTPGNYNAPSGGGEQTTLGTNLNDTFFPHLLASITQGCGAAGTCFIGDGSTAGTPSITDAQIVSLTSSGSTLTITHDANDVIFDLNLPSADFNIVIDTDGNIFDVTDGTATENAFVNPADGLAFDNDTGFLTLDSSGGMIGTGANPINISVGTLNVDNSGGNDVWIIDAGATDTIYNIDISANGGDINVVQSANNLLIGVTTGVLTDAASDVNLTASTGSILMETGSTNAVAGDSVNLSASTGIGAALASVLVDYDPTGAGVLTVDTTLNSGTGDIYVDETNGVLNLSDLTITTDGVSTQIVQVSNSSGAIVVDVDKDFDDDDVTLTTHVMTNDINFQDSTFTIQSTGNITLDASGAVDVGGAEDSTADIIANNVSVTAASGGIGATFDLEVTATNFLDADTTTDGSNIAIDSIGALAIGLVDAGAGNVTLSSTGNMTSFTVDGNADVVGDLVNLSVAGAGTETIGTSNLAPVEINAATLNASTQGAVGEDIFIEDTSGGLIAGLITGGANGDVDLDVIGGNLTSDTTDTTADIVGAVIKLNTTGAGTIGTAAGGGELDIDATTQLNATTAGGDIFIDDEAGGVTIGDNTVLGGINAGVGDVDIEAVNGAISGPTNDGTADVVGATVSLSTTGTGGDIGASGTEMEVAASTEFNADTSSSTGSIFIESIGAINIGLIQTDGANGDVELAATGAIEDQNPDDGITDILADDLVISSNAGIGAARPLEIDVATVSSITSTGNVDINSLATGVPIVTTVTTNGGDFTFDALNGLTINGTVDTTSGTNAGSVTIDSDSNASGVGTFTLTTAGPGTIFTNDSGTDGDFNLIAAAVDFQAGSVVNIGNGAFNFAFSTGANLCLGSSAGGTVGVCDNTLTDGTIDTFVTLAGGSLGLSATGWIVAEDVTVTGNLTLTAGSTIDDSADVAAVGVTAIETTGFLNLTSGGDIGGNSAGVDGLLIDVATLDVVGTGGAGSITITDAGATTAGLNIGTTGVAAGTGDVSLTATTGNITTSGGTITGAGISLTVNEVIAGRIGTDASNPLLIDYTAGNALSLTTVATGGNIFVEETNGTLQTSDLTVTTNAIGFQTVYIENSNADIDVDGAATLGADDSVTFNASHATNGVIDASIASDGVAELSARRITLVAAGNNGVGNTNAVDFTTTFQFDADTGTGAGGNINVNSVGALPLGLIDAGTGNVTISASGGDITENDSGTVDIIATNLDISTTGAGAGIGVSSFIDTDITNLLASTTGSGDDIAIFERDTTTLDGLTLNGNVTTNGGFIDLRAAGDFSDGGNTIETQDVNEVVASGQALIITSAGGNITLTGTVNTGGIDRTLVDGAGLSGNFINITADGTLLDASAATITSDGGDARDTVANATVFGGGLAGLIGLTSNTGSVSVGTVNASGGDAASSVGDGLTASGGSGNTITITSSGGGDVILNNLITARGGAGTNNGVVDNAFDGADGTVTIVSAGGVVDNNNPGGNYAADLDIDAGTLDITAVGDVGTITDFFTGAGNPLELNTNFINQIQTTAGDINIDFGTTSPIMGNPGAFEPGVAAANDLILQSTTGALNVSFFTGGFTLTAGDGIGFIAGTTLTIPNEAGALNFVGNNLLLRGNTDIVDDGLGGDLNPRTLSIAADDLGFFSGGAGGTTIINSTVDSLTANITTAMRDLTVNETDAITLTDIDTNDGDIDINANGSITVVDIDTDVDAASSVSTVSLDVGTGGAIIDGGDAVGDGITARSINLVATTGIANDSDGGGSTVDDRLEIDAESNPVLGGFSANSVSGDINIEDTTGGVAVNASNVVISGATSTNDNIDILATGGTLTITGTILNQQEGDITLTATGGTSDIVIGTNLTGGTVQTEAAAATTSQITITADDSIFFGTNSFVLDTDFGAGSGVTNINLVANDDASGGGVIDMTGAGACTVADCFGIFGFNGTVSLDTGANGGNITTTQVMAQTNTADSAVTINTGMGAVIDGAHLGVFGPEDIITAGEVVITADGGVGTIADPLETSVAKIDVTNAGTSGDINITETNGATVDALQQTNVANTTGTVTLTSTTGDIDLNDGSVLSQGGLITLTALAGAITDADGGTAVLITNNDTTGAATLNATTGIGSADAIDTTIGILTASDAGAAAIRIDDTTGLALNAVNSTAAGNVHITAGGAITDNDGGATLNITANGLELDAVSGIGTIADPIEINAVTLAAETDTGDLAIADTAGGLTIGTVGATSGVQITDTPNDNSGGDDIDISSNGFLTVGVANGDAILNNDGGSITLTTSAGVGNDITINDRIHTLGNAAGVITVDSGNDIFFNNSFAGFGQDIFALGTASTLAIEFRADGDINFGFASGLVSTNGDINMIADDAGGGGGFILMDDFGEILAVNGTVDMSADGNITVGHVEATNSVAIDAIDVTTTSGQVLDAGNTFIDFISANGGLVISAATGVDHLETTVDSVNITNTTGAVRLVETDDLFINTINNGVFQVDLDVSGGAISDGGDNSVDIIAGQLTVTTANGFGAVGTAADRDGFGAPTNDAIETTINNIRLVNTTMGEIQIVETNDLIIDTIDNGTNDVSLTSTGGALIDGGAVRTDIVAGNLTLSALNGIGFDPAVIVDGGGADDNPLEISVTGLFNVTNTNNAIQLDQTGDLIISDTISSGGDISLSSTGAIRDGHMGVDIISGGIVTLNAVNGIGAAGTKDNTVDGDIPVDDELELTVGTINASNTTAGEIQFDETNDLIIGVISNGNRAVNILSGGAITDDADAGAVDITASSLILKAMTGIGATGSTAPDSAGFIETNVITLAAETASGDIAVIETAAGGSIDINQLSTTFTGTVNGADITAGAVGDDIDIRTVNGTLDISRAVDSSSGGTIFFFADGTNSDLSLSGSGNITSQGGSITLQADDSILSTQIVTVASNDGNVLLIANFDDANGNSNDVIDLIDGLAINAGSGTILLDNNTGVGTDGGNIDTGQLISTNNTINAITIDSDAGVIDSNSTGTDITAANGRLNITAGTGGVNGGVGSGGAIIETEVDSIDVQNTTSGTVEITETDDLTLVRIDNGTRAVTLNLGGALTDGDDVFTDITAGTFTVDADTGIGTVANALETSISALDAENATSGDIALDNSGNQLLTITEAITPDGDISISNSGGTGADISIGDIDADTTDDTVTITSTGDIDDLAPNNDLVTDITAFTVDLDAVEGIGATAHVDLEAQDISADTTAGVIEINNDNANPVSVTSLTTTNADITFNQTGNGVPTFTTATTSGTGTINLNAEEGLIIDGAITTVNQDININADTDAAGNGAFTLDAGGSLNTDAGAGDANITAADFDFVAGSALNLGTGVLNLILSQQRSLCLGTVSTCGVNLSNADLAVIAGTGTFTLDNGEFVLTENAVFNANLILPNVTFFDDTGDGATHYESNGTLTIVTSEEVGSAGTSGAEGVNIDVLALDVTTSGDNVTVTDAGATNGDTTYTMSTGAGDVTITQEASNLIFNNITTTGGDVSLTAVNGDISDSTPLDDVTPGTEINIEAHNIVLVGNSIGGAGDADVDITLLTDGTLSASTVATGNGPGPIFIESSGSMAIAQVNAGNADDVTLVAGGDITATDNGTADVIGDTVNLTALGFNIGTGAATSVDVTTSTALNADTGVGVGNIFIDHIGDVDVGLVRAGTGTVTLDSTGDIDSVNDDGVADVSGSTVSLIAASGGIGNNSNVEVTATTALNADTTTDDGDMIIDSIGDLPVGLIDAGTGDVTLDSTGNIDDHETPDLVNIDIIASDLVMVAAGGIGNAGVVPNTTELEIDITNTLDLTTAGVGTAGDIILADIGGNSYDTSDITLTTDGGTTQSVDISANSFTVDADLGDALDHLSLTALTGNITGGAGTLTANTLTLNANSAGAAIGATGGGNNDINTTTNTLIAIANNGAGGIFIDETNDIDLALIDANTGDIELTAGGNISQSAAFTVAGMATLESTGGDIILNLFSPNDFQDTVLLDATNVGVSDDNAITLGLSDATNSFSIFADEIIIDDAITSAGSAILDASSGAGTITDTASGELAVTGPTILNAAGDDIILDNANNDFNNVQVTGNNVTLVDTNAIDFSGASNVTTDLNVTAGGDITDTGTLVVGGITTLDTGANDIILDSVNNFNSIVITSGNNATLIDANTIDIFSTVLAGTLNVTANGAITNSNTVAGSVAATNLTLNSTLAAADIGDAANVFNTDVTGTFNLTTNGGDIYLSDINDLNSTNMTLNTGAGPQTVELTSAGTFSLNTNISTGDNITINSANPINLGAPNVNASNLVLNNNVNLTANSNINAGGGTVDINGDVFAAAGGLTLGINASTLLANDMFLGNTGTLNLNGVNTFSMVTDSLLNAGNIIYPTSFSGTSTLAIDPGDGQSVFLNNLDGGGNIPVSAFAGFNGTLYIGGYASDMAAPNQTLPQNILDAGYIEISAGQLTVDAPLITNGSIYLLGAELVLNDDVSAGGAGGSSLGFVAAGTDPNVSVPGSGNILASSPITVSGGDAIFVATNTIDNPNNITLDLDFGIVEVATGAPTSSIEFGPASRATAGPPQGSQEFKNFLALFSINLNVTQVAFNQAAADLLGIEELGFIDTGLFEEDLTLFGTIGNGIALALAQCEEIEGCAPNVTEEELIELIAQLDARINELQQRCDEGDAKACELLAEFKSLRDQFVAYQEQLKEYLTADEEEFEDEFDDEDLEAPVDTTAEIEKLARMLEAINNRIAWLESLKADPEARARLSEQTGIELTQESLDAIIEGAKSEAQFIQNQINLLQEGLEAKYDSIDPLFTAEARGYNDYLNISYGPSLLQLGDHANAEFDKWF